MTTSSRWQIDQCVDELKQGKLTEESLRRTLEELADGESRRQDLLYLQSQNDYPGDGRYSGTSNAVIGMMLIEGGQQVEVPESPEEWPYQTVGEAVRDGWRVIKFPDMALLLNEERIYGLGCEYILEKWR